MGSLAIVLSQISTWFRQWNNFENRLILGKVKAYKEIVPIFGATLYDVYVSDHVWSDADAMAIQVSWRHCPGVRTLQHTAATLTHHTGTTLLGSHVPLCDYTTHAMSETTKNVQNTFKRQQLNNCTEWELWNYNWRVVTRDTSTTAVETCGLEDRRSQSCDSFLTYKHKAKYQDKCLGRAHVQCDVTSSAKTINDRPQWLPTVCHYALAQSNHLRTRLYLCAKHRPAPWCHKITVRTESQPPGCCIEKYNSKK